MMGRDWAPRLDQRRWDGQDVSERALKVRSGCFFVVTVDFLLKLGPPWIHIWNYFLSFSYFDKCLASRRAAPAADWITAGKSPREAALTADLITVFAWMLGEGQVSVRAASLETIQYPGGRQTSPHTNPGILTGVLTRAPPDWSLGDV